MGKGSNKGSGAVTFVGSALVTATLVLAGPAAALAGGLAYIGGCVAGRVLRAIIDSRKGKSKKRVDINTRLNTPPHYPRINEMPPTTTYTYPDPLNRRTRISVNQYGEIFQR